jgi:C4-dicarboxylate transporter, DctQ subunit
MKFLRSVDTFIGSFTSAVLVTLLGMMILMGFTQVILRNLFSTGIIWADILLRHVVLWIGFLGAIVAAGEKRHITIDALTKVLSERIKKFASIITGIASVFVSYFLTATSYRFLKDEMEFGGTLILDIPIWIFQIIIPVGFGLMTLRFALILLESILAVIRPDPAAVPAEDADA